MHSNSTVGATLKSARESLGLTVRNMAEITRIQPVWLECIEQDRYEEMPDEVFIRGYLKSYARELRLDEEAIFNAYLVQTRQLRQEEPKVVATSEPVGLFGAAKSRKNNDGGRYLYGIAAAVATLLFVGLLIAFLSDSEPDAAATNFRVNDTTDAWQPAVDNTSDWRHR